MNHDAATWKDARLARLVACLSADHTKMRFGALGELARRLDGIDDPETRKIVSRLIETLRGHLALEEHVVFPLIAAMEDAALAQAELSPPLDRGLRSVIERLADEHTTIELLLDELRARAGAERADKLETALRDCIQLENKVLYPRAIALEQRLYGWKSHEYASSPRRH